MSTPTAPTRLGESREALEEFVQATREAHDAVQYVGSLLHDQLDRQVFDTIGALVTNTASAIWDAHPHAEQFIEDAFHSGSE